MKKLVFVISIFTLFFANVPSPHAALPRYYYIGTAQDDALMWNHWRGVIMELFAGDDSGTGGPGNDFLYGGEGNDYLYGRFGNDILIGGPGVDYLYGAEGRDYLFGGEGDDYLDGGSGWDICFGGGSDVFFNCEQVIEIGEDNSSSLDD